MSFTINSFQIATKARVVNPNKQRCELNYFVFDTRKLYFTDRTIFIALKGKSTDGHRFIGEAYNRGVRCFLVSESLDFAMYPDAVFFIVNDTIIALHQLANYHREQFDIPVIGVTGSIGKTSVKEWLYQYLSLHKSIVKNPRSYNSSIGVPLSVLGMRSWHEVGIFEAGPAEVGDMDPLVRMIKPTIGIFTNIGNENNINYFNQQQKIQEKLRLFDNVERLIYCKDHPLIHTEVQRNKIPTYTWGVTEDSDVQLVHQAIVDSQMKLTIKTDQHGVFVVLSPYREASSIENVMHCITCLLYMHMSVTDIQNLTLRLSSPNMRLEMKLGINNCTVLDDSYGADLDSFILAMDFLERQSTKSKKTLIIGDFVKTENHSGTLYRDIAAYINGSSVQKLVGIGQEIKQLEPLLTAKISVSWYDTTWDVIDELWERIDFEEEVILIKGNKDLGLERLKERLYERTHNTVLEVNMYALAKNLKVYSELLDANTKMMVMVKAEAYGSGAIEVAKMLEYNNVDYLSVAYADEGIYLRKYGVETPILVLNPEIPQFDQYIRYELEPEIYSLKMIRQLASFLETDGRSLSIHIKIESGMNRLGFMASEINELIGILQSTPQIRIVSIFSHLASSGEADKDGYTHAQIKRYLEAYDLICDALGVKPMRHILNSAGIIRFPEYHFDMVRLGAGLYGIDSYLPFQEKITTVLSFKSRVSQIKWIEKGASVGYGRGFIAFEDMRIGIISAGYADGIPRSASYGKYALKIQGQLAPILGAIAMDMCVVNLTGLTNIQEGDEVLIFGVDYPVAGLASAAGTISYEIFTSISGRVKRVYYY